MTQQLVVWALLTSLAAFVWLFTCALLTKDRSTREPDDHNDIQA